MPLPQKKSDQKWTYADYLAWDDGQRWELIEGVAYCMSPAPGVTHQRIAGRLFRLFLPICWVNHARCFFLPLMSVFRKNQTSATTILKPWCSLICWLSATRPSLMTVVATAHISTNVVQTVCMGLPTATPEMTKVPVPLLGDLVIDLAEVFAE